MIKKAMSFTDRMGEMVEELQNKLGLMSFSGVVHFAITELYRKEFPAYKETASPEERLKTKKMQKAMQEEEAMDEFRELAKALDGRIVVEGGKEFCVYYNYTGRTRFEQKVPLNMLSSDLVKTQYQPSREKVEQYQKEGKTDY